MDIAKKIKAAEGYAQISEAELARRTGRSSQSLGQRIKTGRFTLDELDEIAKALGAEFVCVFRFPDGMEI